MTEARADIRQGVNLELLEQEREAGRRLNAAAEQETRLLAGIPNDRRLAAIKKEVDAAKAELQEIEERIRVRSPRYSALTKPRPLTLNEIQKDVLDGETALLEYSLGQERSYLFIVTQTSIKTVELPKHSDLENSVRQAVALLSDGERWTTSEYRLNAKSTQVISTLSRVLLPRTFMLQLNVKRLVIVGDGTLHYLPFSSLSSPRLQSGRIDTEAAGLVRPLIADYELVSLPSASSLAVLRRETLNRPGLPRRAWRCLLILCLRILTNVLRRRTVKPVWQSAHWCRREKSDETSLGENRTTLSRYWNERSALIPEILTAGSPWHVYHLRGSKQKQFWQARLLAKSLRATDFRANRETATSPELAQYRFVHFATHAILNSEHPGVIRHRTITG